MKNDFTIQQDVLSNLVAFQRVAQHQNFSRAAEDLNVSPSALSQTIRGLEASLDIQLFNRTTRRVSLTEAGAAFLQHAEQALAPINAAVQTLQSSHDELRGSLRIAAPRGVAEQMILPRLPEFRKVHPLIELELFTEAALTDIVARGMDAGIRLGECLAKDMVAIPIGPAQQQVIVGSKRYFRGRGIPKTPQELVGHNCIRLRRSNGRIAPFEFTRRGRDFTVQVEGDLILNDSDMAHQAAREGLGLCQIFKARAEDDIQRGHLISVLAELQPPFPGFYMYMPMQRHMPPKLRAFVDFFRHPGKSR